MKTNLFALPIVILTFVVPTHGGEPAGTQYSRLNRLQSALNLPSFPEPSQDGIQTWKQKTRSDGMAHKFDFTKFPMEGREEMSLRTFVKFYGGNAIKSDLANVVIISNDGRSVRFVDFEARKSDISVKRGEVVAFLLAETAK